MHTAETSSPEAEVPEVVSELNPHRWKVRPTRLAHLTIQKWTPYGKSPSMLSAANLTSAKTGKVGKKNPEYSRNLRARISEEPDAKPNSSQAEPPKAPKDAKSDPVYNFILKTIRS